LNALIGEWAIEATHPAYPSTLVRGRASVEWLEGEHFLIHRPRADHPNFPDSIAIIGALGDDGDTISGIWELSRDGSSWSDDLEIEYRRIPGATTRAT